MRLHIAMLIVASLACGGGGGSDPYDDSPTGPSGNPPPPAGPAPSSAAVEMTRNGDGYGGEVHGFAPTKVTIARGGSVTWSNASGFAHTVTFAGSDAPPNIPEFTSGSVQREFPAAGTYSYSCTNHQGMTGQVVVQ